MLGVARVPGEKRSYKFFKISIVDGLRNRE
jgi:hypothetical protein